MSSSLVGRVRPLPTLLVTLALGLGQAPDPRAELLPLDQGESWRQLELPDGAVLDWALVLPDDYTPDREWPVLIALPGGVQDREAVTAGLMRFWGMEASRRGWIVASPAAPGGVRFHEGGERHLPALLDRLQTMFDVEGGRFHLAGTSSGGLGAFRLAESRPQSFHSLVVLPGGPASPEDLQHLHRLRGLAVRMFAGGEDEDWRALTERTARLLRQLGVDVELEIAQGEGHLPLSLLSNGRVMAVFDDLRASLKRMGPPSGDPARTIDWLLSELRSAERRGDGASWLSTFTADAVVLGPELGSRWRADAMGDDDLDAIFAVTSGASRKTVHREILVERDGRVGWFDDLRVLDDERLLRTTGVARRGEAGWRIVHLSLAAGSKAREPQQAPTDEGR